jgi:hypothetical protein
MNISERNRMLQLCGEDPFDVLCSVSAKPAAGSGLTCQPVEGHIPYNDHALLPVQVAVTRQLVRADLHQVDNGMLHVQTFPGEHIVHW